MKIGYARVSTKDQNLEMQTEALRKYGCEKIYLEKVSGLLRDRPELDKLLKIIRKKDIVVVWKLDRLGRSLNHLIELMNTFNNNEVGFVSINDNIDTNTVTGRLVFSISASFAEFEREIRSERTLAGLKRARENGRVGGKRPGLSESAKIKARYTLHTNKMNNKLPRSERKSIEKLSQYLAISRATFYRYLEWAKREEIEKADKKKNQNLKS